MAKRCSVGIDIGSTWTKGALFEQCGGELRLHCRAAHPTTVDDLSIGFSRVLAQLGISPQQLAPGGTVELNYSSSAKGGLAVAALGLVPDITLETAKLAAHSAGAKLTQVFAYRLTRADIAMLETRQPDILLFAGGTDGGNADYVLRNARALAASSLGCAIVYAGNRDLRDEVAGLLAHKDFQAVDNLLPTLDAPQPEPAREALRAIFLRRIVKGKGLDRVVRIAGSQPVPTPYAMVDFTQAIRTHVPGWHEFMLVDIGGATTDVYSAHRESPTAGTVIRGLPEPDVKRTVEGDLGLRVCARTTWESARAELARHLEAADIERLHSHVERVSVEPARLSGDASEAAHDASLAGFCLAEACMRHAGRSHEVSTPDGLVQLQAGRDLRGVRRLIGSGGWLAHAQSFDPATWLSLRRIDARGRQVLLPGAAQYWRDADHLFPLLANVAQRRPAEAARAAVRALVPHFTDARHGTVESQAVGEDLLV